MLVTNTAGLAIQSILARALNDVRYALISDLDLSCAFDMVKVKLILKRLGIMGLPMDILYTLGVLIVLTQFDIVITVASV